MKDILTHLDDIAVHVANSARLQEMFSDKSRAFERLEEVVPWMGPRIGHGLCLVGEVRGGWCRKNCDMGMGRTRPTGKVVPGIIGLPVSCENAV